MRARREGLAFDSFDVLTFDCYGTLIDWETGILTALRPILAERGVVEEDAALLARFARYESAIQAGPFRSYRSVLQEVVGRFGEDLGFVARDEERSALAASVPDWPAFDDTVPALRALASRYRLAVVSNVDEDLFAGSASRLGVTFDEVVTAEAVGSYKPHPRHFEVALERLDVAPERVLHVAQSLFHDIGPANRLGWSCVWVNRRSGRSGSGATVPAAARPDLEVPDLATLVERVSAEDGERHSSGAGA